MKTEELWKKSKAELQTLLEKERHKLEELSWLIRQKKAKNTKDQGVIKKDIARILTILKSHHEAS